MCALLYFFREKTSECDLKEYVGLGGVVELAECNRFGRTADALAMAGSHIYCADLLSLLNSCSSCFMGALFFEFSSFSLFIVLLTMTNMRCFIPHSQSNYC